ncbi:MAG: B12-binding domain-containing radical SAM protein [Candidatus Aminicenantales bacterium]
MARILLINPWIYDFTAYDFWLKPLGLLYVASLLRKYTDFELNYIDCLDRHHPLLPKRTKVKPDARGPFPKEEVPKPSPLKEIPRKFSRYGIPVPLFLHELERVKCPDLVLLTCTMTYWYPGVQLAVELLRQKFGRVPVALGGIYATLLPGHARSATGVDFVLQGGAERELFPFLRQVFGNSTLPEIKLETLDEFPKPAFELLRDKSFLPLLASRGCPYCCTFCASSFLNPCFEQRNPESVFREIESSCLEFGTKKFAFYDDALLCRKKELIIPLLKRIIEERLELEFYTPNGLHLKEIDSEVASLLKRAGFESLFLSQESFQEEVLKKASSKVCPDDLERVLLILEKAGFERDRISVYLIVGLPGQDKDVVKEDILHVLQLGARPHLAYFSPLPHTGEWCALVKKGILDLDSDPLLHNKLAFLYLKSEISPPEVDSLKSLLYRE